MKIAVSRWYWWHYGIAKSGEDSHTKKAKKKDKKDKNATNESREEKSSKTVRFSFHCNQQKETKDDRQAILLAAKQYSDVRLSQYMTELTKKINEHDETLTEEDVENLIQVTDICLGPGMG